MKGADRRFVNLTVLTTVSSPWDSDYKHLFNYTYSTVDIPHNRDEIWSMVVLDCYIIFECLFQCCGTTANQYRAPSSKKKNLYSSDSLGSCHFINTACP
jgi:hypothetical protein